MLRTFAVVEGIKVKPNFFGILAILEAIVKNSLEMINVTKTILLSIFFDNF